MTRVHWWLLPIGIFFLSATALADLPGDSDGDGDLDANDAALFALCQSGPADPALGVCATYFDLNVDSDIDLLDFAEMQCCFSGPGKPGNPDCAPHHARIENRCLLVFGTAADSDLSLRLRPGAPSILEVDVDIDGAAEFSFDRSIFDCIFIDARAGNDTVVIDELSGVFTDVVPTTIVGGSGDDTDVIEGGFGIDVVEVNGSSNSESFSVTANGTRVRFDRLSPAPFFLDINACESLLLAGNAGNDSLACTGNLATLIQITADGGPGDDTLLGSNGNDLLIGGDNNDFIDGQQGLDTVLLGAGDDTFQWDPGDGNDTVEGQAGQDRVLFNGSNTAEVFDFNANGSRLRFTRNIASITLDADGVERFDLRTLGGADVINVNHLAGVALAQVNVDLASTLGGTGGDASADNVIVNGTNAEDALSVVGAAGSATANGLPAVVTVLNPEPTIDRLTVNALGGSDDLEATGLAPNVIGLTLSGGSGDDVIVGSPGIDLLAGDDDNDTIAGGGSQDTILLGAGADRFVWSPGDGGGIIEGGDGADVVEVNGANDAESFTVTANGTRVRFDRISPGPFFLDINACETLLLLCNAGNDSLACTGSLVSLIQITADGGPGDDSLLGSNGNDLLIGGDDNDFVDGQQGLDTVILGNGDDRFQWDPGDGNDTVEGQQGHDAIIFNGSNIGEILDFSANGSRLRFTRNVGNVVLDADGIDQFDLRTLGGADAITVNSLDATTVAQLNIDLAATLGGQTGDAAADAITVNGSAFADAIHVGVVAGVVEVSGLAPLIRIKTAEPALDSLTVNGQAGADSITSDPGVPALIMLFSNP